MTFNIGFDLKTESEKVATSIFDNSSTIFNHYKYGGNYLTLTESEHIRLIELECNKAKIISKYENNKYFLSFFNKTRPLLDAINRKDLNQLETIINEMDDCHSLFLNSLKTELPF